MLGRKSSGRERFTVVGFARIPLCRHKPRCDKILESDEENLAIHLQATAKNVMLIWLEGNELLRISEVEESCLKCRSTDNYPLVSHRWCLLPMPKYKAPPGRGSWRRLPQLVQQRVLTEWRLKRQGMNFRADNPNVCSRAYARMSDDEFAAINACQEWANWRIIPRLVTRIQAQGPWSVIDLGCGQGVSTEVLAWYSPENSHFLGYDLCETALSRASLRKYSHSSGQTAKVNFRRQQIDQTWQDSQGQPIADGSITLVNASGIIGHHLSSECVLALVTELSRVLAVDGWALLDVGPHRGRHELSRLMSAAGFSCQRRARSWWLDPCGQLAFRRSTMAKPSRFKPLTRRGANRDNFNPSLASRNWTQVHCGTHNSVDANNT